MMSYPKAFDKYWASAVGLYSWDMYENRKYKHTAYLAWMAGRRHENGKEQSQ